MAHQLLKGRDPEHRDGRLGAIENTSEDVAGELLELAIKTNALLLDGLLNAQQLALDHVGRVGLAREREEVADEVPLLEVADRGRLAKRLHERARVV